MPDRFANGFLIFIIWFGSGPGSALGQQRPDLAGHGPSRPSILSEVAVRPQADGLAIDIAISTPLVPTANRLTNPDRLVFDFPGCALQGGNRRIPINRGPVRELRLSQFTLHPPVARIVVDSKVPLDFKLKPAAKQVVIDIKFPAAPVPTAPATPLPRVNPPVEEEHAATSRGSAQKHTGRPIASAARARASAYGLQAAAKALTLPDLQPLEERAEAGDPEAETTLGLAYHDGVLLKRNDAEAMRLLHKAADQGYMAAEESLGILSERGVGMEKPSPAEALEWYKKAVRQGSLDAATNIGLMYAEGRGVPKNPAEALPWLRQAADGGDGAAQYNLALLYGRGDGIPKNEKESVRWLTAAADQNVLPALLDLANFYLHRPASAKADLERSSIYYEKAAELGNAYAQAMLGTIFAKGLLGTPDYEQSVKWYRKAAEQGERDGECGLAIRYALGEGVPVDLKEARRLFTAAADQGQLEAQYNLGVMFEQGKGGPADRAAAEHYWQLAAEQGATKAQFRLGQLLASTRNSRSDRVSAYKWLTLAADSVKESAAALDDLKKTMNEQEIADAEHEVDAWRSARSAVKK